MSVGKNTSFISQLETGKLKTVDAEASVIKEAKAIGISFGD